MKPSQEVKKQFKFSKLFDSCIESFRNIFFTHLAFDYNNEETIAVDSRGTAYVIKFYGSNSECRKIGYIGKCTFISFLPSTSHRIIFGTVKASVKFFNLRSPFEGTLKPLSGHVCPPSRCSFYKNYCLTSSSRDALIWHLDSCSILHKLNLQQPDICLTKASFSNLGKIVSLYQNDSMQVWNFQKLDEDVTLKSSTFGIRNIRDFAFTVDGKALILAGSKNTIVVLNTLNWQLIKKCELEDHFFGIRQLEICSEALDGGANKLVLLLSTNCKIRFCDLQSLNLFETTLNGVKKVAVSKNGSFLGYINQNGNLSISSISKIEPEAREYVKKVKETSRAKAHGVKTHLRAVSKDIEEELNLDRLLLILEEFKEYPKKYRSLIWSTILKLPLNTNSYASLSNRIPIQCSSELLKDCQLRDRSKASLLAMTIEKLIQWCPFLSQSQFLPKLVFPFMTVFQGNPVAAFETILFILRNFCQKWFEYHPLPPLNILGIMENMLLEADQQLLHVYCEKGITSTIYAWPLLQTFMSEVLSGEDWLILLDHLFSYNKPSLLLTCVVAFNILIRESVFALPSKDIFQLFENQSCVRIRDLMKLARQLDQNLPSHVHPSYYIRDEFNFLPPNSLYPQFLLNEYPEFLTERSVMDLEISKEQERVLKEYHQNAMQIAEERRIRSESEAFLQKIHQSRLDEVRKCYDRERNKIKWDLHKTQSNLIDLREEECSCKTESSSSSLKSSKSGTSNYSKLWNDVEKLEYEVQHFLQKLK